MKYCNCPGCKVVMEMESSIQFDELTGYDQLSVDSEYKNLFKELVKKHFGEEKTNETDQVVKSKVS